MLDALQLLRYFGAGFWPLLLQSLCLLLQDRQPHGDVEPIEKMLAERMKILLYSANIFATVGHEHHLLIFLHSLRFHQLPETPAWFLVIGLHKAKTLRRGYVPDSARTAAHRFLCTGRPIDSNTYPMGRGNPKEGKIQKLKLLAQNHSATGLAPAVCSTSA